MTAKELAEKLLALPEDLQNHPVVFSGDTLYEIGAIEPAKQVVYINDKPPTVRKTGDVLVLF